MASEFESWLSERLTQFNADGDVFSSYILGILDSEETQDEKQDNLCDLLEGLGLDDGQVDPCERLKKEIWSKWSSVKDPSVEDEKAKEKPIKATDLGATLAAHAESQTKAFKQSKGMKDIWKHVNLKPRILCFTFFSGHGSSSSNDKDKEAIKAAILAQYNNAVEESGSEEESDGCDDSENDLMAKNTNAEAVAKAQQDQREKSKAAAQAKKDKDKEDREKQKKDQEDRKKKAQEKAAKGERKRWIFT